MKVAVIGSRSLAVRDIGEFIPKETTEIVSGGARGIDSCAAVYARKMGLKLTVFLPQYEIYGNSAPIRRNLQIIDYADQIVAIWDGNSNGTRFVINNAKKKGKPIRVFEHK